MHLLKRWWPSNLRLTWTEFLFYCAVGIGTIFLLTHGWHKWSIMLLLIGIFIIAIIVVLLGFYFPNHTPAWTHGFLELVVKDHLFNETEHYTITVIHGIRPCDINNQSHIVGFQVSETTEWQAVTWKAGVMTKLGGLGGHRSCAVAINERGQIVGWAETADGVRHAVLWQDGVITDLGPGIAFDINVYGQIVGDWCDPQGQLGGAARWDNGVMVLRGESCTFMRSINDKGEIAGGRSEADGICHAILWSQGQSRELNEVSGLPWNIGMNINNQGQVLVAASNDDWENGRGQMGNGLPEERVLLWDNEELRELEMFPGCYTCESPAMNNLGQAVGYSKRSPYFFPPPLDFDDTAFLWKDGKMQDLTNWTKDLFFVDGAAAINDLGQIVAWKGTDGCLFTPVHNEIGSKS